MSGISRTEYLLMENLHRRDSGLEPGLRLLEQELALHEKDSMNRIRELVAVIEKLEREGYLATDTPFYEESDHMSFTYLNSATALYEEKVRLSPQGTELIETFLKPRSEAGLLQTVRHTASDTVGRRALWAVGILGFLLGLAVGFTSGRFWG